MAIDYAAVANDQARLERTAANSIRTLARLYADRAHFMFELLQNAEDALRRRPAAWSGPHTVNFQLCSQSLRVSHYGEPFNSRDVENICSVGETEKDLTDIGKLGIGFKSVYAFTDRPTIHSGPEDFAIADFVRPTAVPRIDRDPGETAIIIPLRMTDELAHDEIAHGLGSLGTSTLLFLREIEEIHWNVEGGRSGLYLRDSKEIGPGVRAVTVMGKEDKQPELDEEWLIFSQAVTANGGLAAGQVELAFSLVKDDQSQLERIRRLKRSPLVVFFPTVLETHLGFLVQGPYRTTPSRDNVPGKDDWNKHLVGETASLLRQALWWLRDNDFLDTNGLGCLPIDSAMFGQDSMFAPLYDATKSALSSESILPRFDAGHVAAACARIGRTQELRNLFTPAQLAALYGEKHQLVWLSGDITQDRTPELRRYLMQRLDIPELTAETVIPQLGREYLEVQSDIWIERLYEFLSGQPSLRPRLEDAPLIRLENGTHVPPRLDGQAQAFLPSEVATGFPVVRSTVCVSERSLEFLRSLGLSQPDPVDDIVRNVLPRYRADEADVSYADYETDIGRIRNAFATDSKGQREKLEAALRESAFVMTVDSGDRSKRVSKPGKVYLSTERLRELFDGVDGVFLVDGDYPCLRGDSIRELLEACGATRSLRPVPGACDLSGEHLAEIRRNAGLERSTSDQAITDRTLHGLDGLLNLLPKLEPVERQRRAALLWEALVDLENRRGARVFVAEYSWSYSHETKTATIDGAFVRQLLKREWVPDSDGSLHAPELVAFATLGWKRNPFLLSKIRFKPPIIDQLAKEAGIEPGVLDLLKKLGVTSEAKLRARLGVPEDDAATASDSENDMQDVVEKLVGASNPTSIVSDPADQEPVKRGSIGGRAGFGAGTGSGGERKPGSGASGDASTQDLDTHSRPTGGKRTPGSSGGRPFVSYVGVHLEDEAPDPDDLDQADRMALEARAIEFILSYETGWQRTPPYHPGFDLFETGPDEQPKRWCEVKAMTGNLSGRPVALSRTQFDFARGHGDAYWLYIVERAGTDSARIVRIQDPAGNARSFTFDHGWLEIAVLDRDEERQED